VDGVILLLVFGAFSDSVAEGLWTRHGAGLLAMTSPVLPQSCAGAVADHAGRGAAAGSPPRTRSPPCSAARRRRWRRVPMAKVLFGAHPALGVIVLPLTYHQLQLFVCCCSRSAAQRAA
jgi:sodium/bile acid cotransporter 7